MHKGVPATHLPDLDKYLGPVLIGSWLNVALFTIQITQVVYYFRNYKDRPITRFAVTFTLFISALTTLSIFALTYLYTIRYWGQLEPLLKLVWLGAALPILKGLTQLVTQLFLTHRYWNLSRNHLTVSLLISLVALPFASSILVSVRLVTHPEFHQRKHLRKVVTLWLSTAAVSDLVLAAALVFTLRRVNTTVRSTQSLVRRVILTTVSSNSLTALMAVCPLIIFLTDIESNVPLVFTYTFAPIVALTMLINLNTRRKPGESDDEVVSPRSTEGGAATRGRGRRGADAREGSASATAPTDVAHSTNAIRFDRMTEVPFDTPSVADGDGDGRAHAHGESYELDTHRYPDRYTKGRMPAPRTSVNLPRRRPDDQV